jgi:hypothetical protein
VRSAAAGEIDMRKADGWQTLATKLIDQPVSTSRLTSQPDPL